MSKNSEALEKARQSAQARQAQAKTRTGGEPPVETTDAQTAGDEATSDTAGGKTGAKAKPKSALPTLPPLPRGARKSKPPQECGCGCGNKTRGGKYVPGHDARLAAWALRVERQILKIDEVPEMHREAVRRMLGKNVLTHPGKK